MGAYDEILSLKEVQVPPYCRFCAFKQIGKLRYVSPGVYVYIFQYFASPFLNETGDLDERGMFTPLNALYCRALLSASKLYQDAGMEEKSAACIAQATKLAEKIRLLACPCPDARLECRLETRHPGGTLSASD